MNDFSEFLKLKPLHYLLPIYTITSSIMFTNKAMLPWLQQPCGEQNMVLYHVVKLGHNWCHYGLSAMRTHDLGWYILVSTHRTTIELSMGHTIMVVATPHVILVRRYIMQSDRDATSVTMASPHWLRSVHIGCHATLQPQNRGHPYIHTSRMTCGIDLSNATCHTSKVWQVTFF